MQNSECRGASEFLLRVQRDPPVDLFVRQGAGDSGSPVLVFLHGFPESSAAWEWYLEHFSRRGYRCLAPDLRGYGRSSKPPGVAPYQFDRLVADVDALLEQACDRREPVYLVGHDWGGAIVWEYAARHAERLAGIVVLNAPHRAAAAFNLRRDRALRRRQLVRSWYVLFFQIPWLPELVLRASGLRLLDRAFRSWAVRDDVFSVSYLDTCRASLRIPGALTAALNYYRANALRRFVWKILVPRAPVFPGVECRALLLWGTRDRALDRGLIRDIDAFFPRGIQVRLYEDASHWINHEHRERVAADIEAFVKPSGND